MNNRGVGTRTCCSRTTAAIVTFAILCIATALSYADALPAPEGPVLLKITGNLRLPNVGDELHLDKQTLEAFELVTFSTHTIQSEGLQAFTGVRLSDLFKAAGANPESFIATGIDDYKFTVTGKEIWEYPVIVAYKQNGEYMNIRKLGPLRIMFPFDDYPELQTQKNEASAVWQLIELELQ